MVDDGAEDDGWERIVGMRATGLNIPLLLTFRNPIWGSHGPHQVKLTQIRPLLVRKGDYVRGYLTLNLILTSERPHVRQKVQCHNVSEAADGTTGEIIQDFQRFLADRAVRPDLADYPLRTPAS